MQERNKFYDRASVDISLNLSHDVIETLEKIAKKKNLSVDSVIKFFIGQGLRSVSSSQEISERARKRLNSRKGVSETVEIDLAA